MRYESDTTLKALVEIGKPAVLPLVDMLHDSNEVAREKAAEALGKIGDDQALDALVTTWKTDKSGYVQEYAADAIARMGKKAVPVLIAEIKENSDGYWGPAAVKILAKMRESSALIEALDFPSVDSRDLIKGDIANALGTLGDQSAKEPLKKLFNHKEESVRYHGYDALVALGWEPTTVTDKVLVLLAAGCSIDTHQRQYGHVVGDSDAIAKCIDLGQDAVAPCVDLLKHPSREVRIRACKVLGGMNTQLAAPYLVELFANDDQCREAAGKALASLGETGLASLRELQRDYRSSVRSAAIKYLASVPVDTLAGDDDTVNMLIANTKDNDKSIRDSALRSLGYIKTDKSVAAICEAMQVKDFYPTKNGAFTTYYPGQTVNRQIAAEALGRIGNISVKPLIDIINKCNEESDKDNENVASWCAYALGIIRSPEAVEPLFRLAQNEWEKNGNAKEMAMDALSKIGEPAESRLADLLMDKRHFVRHSAIGSLFAINQKSKIDNPHVILSLISELYDDDEYCQNDAKRLLSEIAGTGSIEDVFMRLAYSRFDNGKTNETRALAEQYEDFTEKRLSRVLDFTTEQQRVYFLNLLSGNTHPYSMLAAANDAEGMARGVLRLKVIGFDSSIENRQIAAESADPKINQLLSDLSKAKQQNNQSQVDSIEGRLAENFAITGKTRRALLVNVSDVQNVLPTNTVLLEFVRYSQYLGNGGFEPQYGVVLIGGGETAFKDAQPGEPVWVPLGSAATIEQSLKEYQAVMRGEKPGEASLIKRLYTLLFTPIEQRLPQGINTLIISPDAELNFVNLATLLDGQDKFLAEKYTIKYVSSGRDLVFGRKPGKGTRRLSVFANPAFDMKPGLANSSDTNKLQPAMLPTDQRDYAGLNLPPLPGTAVEAGYLQDKCAGWKLDGAVYEGVEASKAQVMAVKSPYILHLATHGFFLPDTEPTNRPDMGGQMPDVGRLPVVWHNPMQRSGLALAGAQLTLDAWRRGETPHPENDGILTAQDVGTMDLNGTWLVVLSACDTGDGEARAGEGVMGLRRGFVQAGAQNLLMTLWPVSDHWTMEMMEAFYDRALKTGDAPGALAEVQREYLVKLKEQKNPVTAARLAGPFILTFRGLGKD
jgi:HEAT repeat protein/CHAT domain-containing protein